MNEKEEDPAVLLKILRPSEAFQMSLGQTTAFLTVQFKHFGTQILLEQPLFILTDIIAMESLASFVLLESQQLNISTIKRGRSLQIPFAMRQLKPTRATISFRLGTWTMRRNVSKAFYVVSTFRYLRTSLTVVVLQRIASLTDSSQ